jgi:hypothetical protein
MTAATISAAMKALTTAAATYRGHFLAFGFSSLSGDSASPLSPRKEGPERLLDSR